MLFSQLQLTLCSTFRHLDQEVSHYVRTILHWLPHQVHRQFCVLCIVALCLSQRAPSYFCELLHPSPSCSSISRWLSLCLPFMSAPCPMNSVIPAMWHCIGLSNHLEYTWCKTYIGFTNSSTLLLKRLKLTLFPFKVTVVGAPLSTCPSRVAMLNVDALLHYITSQAEHLWLANRFLIHKLKFELVDT